MATENPDDHHCVEDFSVYIGNDAGAYDGLVSAFNARLILINPLVCSLPKLPVLIMPTCNRFNHEFVYSHWCQLGQLFQQFHEPVLSPLIGKSSDGDRGGGFTCFPSFFALLENE